MLADLKAQLEAPEKKIAGLKEKLISLPEQETKQVAGKPFKRKPRKSKSQGNGYTPEELRNMEFDLLDLSDQGELGAFLGNIEARADDCVDGRPHCWKKHVLLHAIKAVHRHWYEHPVFLS